MTYFTFRSKDMVSLRVGDTILVHRFYKRDVNENAEWGEKDNELESDAGESDDVDDTLDDDHQDIESIAGSTNEQFQPNETVPEDESSELGLMPNDGEESARNIDADVDEEMRYVEQQVGMHSLSFNNNVVDGTANNLAEDMLDKTAGGAGDSDGQAAVSQPTEAIEAEEQIYSGLLYQDEYAEEDEWPIEPGTVSDHTCAWLVTSILKDDSDTVVDVNIRYLNYVKAAEVPQAEARLPAWTYRIYGNEVRNSLTSQDLARLDEAALSACRDIDPSYRWEPAPLDTSGDNIRAAIFSEGNCPAHCHDGILQGAYDLVRLMPEGFELRTTLPYRPICPVCIGLELVQRQHQLRQRLETIHDRYDMLEDAMDLYHDLKSRRTDVGYEERPFDEREWGFAFDDEVDDVDDFDDDTDDSDAFEAWDEANDPNGNIQLRPTPKAVIDSVRRAKVGDVKGADSSDRCLICQETFEEDVNVAILDCKHFFCEACLVEWLTSWDNCPICRTKVD